MKEEAWPVAGTGTKLYDDEPIIPKTAREAVRVNKDLPIVEGMLKKRSARWAGLGSTTWNDRWIQLDPASGVVSCWKASAPASDPPKEMQLEDVLWIETNQRHLILQIAFCKPTDRKSIFKVWHLQAADELDFERWLDPLSSYGMRRPPKTPKTSTPGN